MKRVFAEYDQDFLGASFWSWNCPSCGHYDEEHDNDQKSKIVSCEECQKTYLITFYRDEAVEYVSRSHQATAS
ncbi:MAG: hypothetical protein ACOH5I_18075 [Oligoflexus sp.]